MSRRTLARIGGASGVLGGLVLAAVAVQNVVMGLFVTPGPFPGQGQLVALSTLAIIPLLLVPSAIVVGLRGLVSLLGTSSVAMWGARFVAVATLSLVVRPLIPYVLFLDDPSPGIAVVEAALRVSVALSVLTSAAFAAGLLLLYVAARRYRRLGSWRPILPAIGLTVILSSTAPHALAAVGLTGNVPLSAAFEFVVGVLWVALGVAVWRESPSSDNHDTGATPLTL